ncbi:plasmid mobilization relaxosome protein MobC [Sulfuricurvum sp.]|uniref:plasmid mobilization protein n=1 Tax=Sulfuricurvum sp. TaxID=2025608 RepID=UPI00261E75BB|nr:plasmid mobilization relaxosome protein MobC [Sulfuricurvum sp.]MDD3596177.1 plasmid mobilization relaxosome protein MobC [Sulfuricurvum sp.]
MSKRNTVTIRLSDELFAELLIKAQSLNMTVSDYVRGTICNTELNYRTNEKDFGYLIGSINRVGNNINQIAHNLNIARNEQSLDQVDYEDIMNQLIIINSEIKSLM